MRFSSMQRWVLMLTGIICLCVVAEATEPLADQAGPISYDLWMGHSGVQGQILAYHAQGEVVCADDMTTIRTSLVLSKLIAWRPNRITKELMQKTLGDSSSPLNDGGSIQAVLARNKDDEWSLTHAQDTLHRQGDAARSCIELCRLLYLLFEGRRELSLDTFDTHTFSETDNTVRVASFGSQASSEDAAKGSSLAKELMLVRADGLDVEVFALSCRGKRTRAISARIRAGAADPKANRQALANEGVARVKALFQAITASEGIVDEDISRFLDEWQEWRADIDISFGVIDLQSAREGEPAVSANKAEDDRAE